MSVAARRAFLRLARRATPYLGVERHGSMFVVSTGDGGVGRTAFLSGANPEFAALDRAIVLLRERGQAQPGSVFVDVGANIGTTTVPALARHGFGRALAFEPEPENVPLLRANVALNGLDERVVVVPAAVSEAPGRSSFGRGTHTRRGRRAGAGGLARRGDERVEVDVVTLDESLATHAIAPEEVGLVWIDVQGHEGHVLAGAARLLAARPPVVVALRPRKLAKAGGRELLLESLDGYDALLDLRDPAADVRDADELEALLRGGAATDVVAFRAGPARAGAGAGESAG